MATYVDLRHLFSDAALANRIEVACIVAAETIRGESDQTANHANRLLWAQRAFNAPKDAANKMVMAVLAANKSATVAQITGATDATLQAAVDAAVNLFADGS